MKKSAKSTAKLSKPSKANTKSGARPYRPRLALHSRAKGGTDWAAVDAKTDEDIARDMANDPDAIEFTEDLLADASFVVAAEKRTPVLLKMEPDVLAFYKQGGKGYQTRMQKVLRAFMEQSQRATAKK